MRAVRMLELSPLVTAARAPARSMPASSRWSRSKPKPTTVRPPKPWGRRRKALLFLSTTSTLWPSFSRVPASSLPTRPQPTTTTCTARMLTQGRQVKPPSVATTGPSGRWHADARVSGPETPARREAALQRRSGAPAADQDDRPGRLLLRRHLLHGLRHRGDPAGPRAAGGHEGPRLPDPHRLHRLHPAGHRGLQLPADDLRLPERRRLLHRLSGEPRGEPVAGGRGV